MTVLHRFYCSLQNVADINYVMEKVYAAHFCDMWGSFDVNYILIDCKLLQSGCILALILPTIEYIFC